MAEFAVILPAAGKSSRFGGKEKKPFTHMDGRALWLHTAERFINREDVCQSMLVISPDDDEMVRRRFMANLAFMGMGLVHGGAERFESVAKALATLKPDAEFVAVHDAVRPCVTTEMIDAVFAKAKECGAAVLAAAVADTVKQTDDKKNITQTVSRDGLWLAQTPQVFRRDWLEEAYAKRDTVTEPITDDAQLVSALGRTVAIVEGDASNIKVTKQGDVALAEAILKCRPKPKEQRPLHPFAEDEMWGGRT